MMLAVKKITTTTDTLDSLVGSVEAGDVAEGRDPDGSEVAGGDAGAGETDEDV